MRPTDVLPKPLIDELLRLYRLDPDWVQFEELEPPQYRAVPKYPTWLTKACRSGADLFSMHAASVWLGGGPKVFQPTMEQCEALERVEVNIALVDYAQPYPALLVELPKGVYSPFNSVLCFYRPRPYLIATLYSDGHLSDISTTVAVDGRPIELSLVKFDEDCAEDAKQAARVLRIAVNSCLALANYGHHLSYLFLKEVESDRRLARESTERGQRARARLPLAVQVLTFSQEVVLHRVERQPSDAEPTGRQMPPHWRRGHWRMQPFGEARSQRKRIFVPPVLVRKDLFVGDLSDTGATYR